MGIATGPAELGIPCLLSRPILCPGGLTIRNCLTLASCPLASGCLCKGGHWWKMGVGGIYCLFPPCSGLKLCFCLTTAPGLRMCSNYQCILPLSFKFTLQYACSVIPAVSAMLSSIHRGRQRDTTGSVSVFFLCPLSAQEVEHLLRPGQSEHCLLVASLTDSGVGTGSKLLHSQSESQNFWQELPKRRLAPSCWT